ncbi:hypothetical protein VSA01S_22190 [Vibrio sagamiensis NBRC 104589]|uniref:Outer membrane protein OmpA-like transmembrane domain-containing protein n=2 Tax=Vibrio sagamiensis TaxID=512650 RepID=A0A511QFY2_9VIBR|nr:hypothetical protein VSA01S_22190 [Vibrio sagamiensis NBRC 104589]
MLRLHLPLFLCGLLMSSLSFGASSMTLENNFYLGVKAGYQFSQDDTYRYEGDPEGGGIASLFAGYQITPQWAIEAGYQYHADLHASDKSADIKASVIEAAVRYDWYWQDNISLYGRFSFVYWDMVKRSSDFQQDAIGFSPLGEVGLAYQFTPKLKGSLGYQYIDEMGNSKTRYYDSHSIMWSLSYFFQSDNAIVTESVIIRPVKTDIIKQIDDVANS